MTCSILFVIISRTDCWRYSETPASCAQGAAASTFLFCWDSLFIAIFGKVINHRSGASAFLVSGLLVAIMPLEVSLEILAGFEGSNLIRYVTGVLFGAGFSMILGTFWAIFFAGDLFPKPGKIWQVSAGQVAVAALAFGLSLLLWQWAIFNILVFAGLASAYFVVNIILAHALLGIRQLFSCIICSVVLTAVEWYLLYQANNISF
ncbi:MAG: hypothetical protein U5N86_05345 [Planctomycetota bacterium]|nr:hypothetical protein [Planctomycetota bacterium]